MRLFVIVTAAFALACAAGKDAGSKDGAESGGESGAESGGESGAESGSGSSGENGGENGSDNSGENSGASCLAGAFEPDATSWSLPEGPRTDTFEQSSDVDSSACDESSFTHALVDLDGDALPDLVVTDSCDDRIVGQTHWLVYRSEGTGFAASAAEWSLPDAPMYDAFDTTADVDGSGCEESSFTHALVDLDGDARPDLVVTDACDDRVVGHTHWEVYRNEGDGFDTTAQAWALPDGVGYDDFDQTADVDGGSCDESSFAHALVDMDGDTRPDLVVTDACDDRIVGNTHWLVYRNEGDGFATTATEWALPEGLGYDAFDVVADVDGSDCAESSFAHALLDMDGDARPDLVVTDACDDRVVGHTHWEVYLNEGGGFDPTPLPWALPEGIGYDAFDLVADSTSADCEASSHSHTLLDLTADGRPDLVVTDACDDRIVGTTHWDVYRNEGGGFATTADAWALPDAPFYDAFEEAADNTSASCESSNFIHLTTNLTGDGLPDLVVTDACDDRTVGHVAWWVYPGVCVAEG